MSQNKVAIWKLKTEMSQHELIIQTATQALALAILCGSKYMPEKGAKIRCKLEFPDKSISAKMKITTWWTFFEICIKLSNKKTKKKPKKFLWNTVKY